MPEPVIAPPVAAAVPPPAPPAAAAPAAPPPPAAVPPAAVPAVEPAKPAAAAAPAPEVKPAVPAVPPAEPPKAQAVPGEIALTLPEGAKYDPVAIGEFKKIFADEKMTPADRAQAVIDFDHKHAKAKAEANAKAIQQQAEQQTKADIEALKADKEFGGALFNKTVADAKSAAQQFFDEDFSKLMVASGLANHPSVVKGLARIRKALGEDTTGSRVPGSTPPVTEQKPMSRTQRWKQQYLPKPK